MLRVDRHGHKGDLGREDCAENTAGQAASERQSKHFLLSYHGEHLNVALSEYFQISQ